MVSYSPFAVSVDGTSLDSAAWNVSVKTRTWAAGRNADTVLPGTDGVVQSLNDDLEPTTMTLKMWALGTDQNGIVPATTNGMAQVRANLDDLSFLFGKKWSLLNVVETVDAQGRTRQAWCKVNDSVTPDVRAGALAEFTVTLQVGEGMWQDETASDWSTSGAISAGVSYEVTSLQGSTASINDGIFLVTGPVTNPQLTDYTTGAYCRLNFALPAGQAWRLNSGTWTSRYGTGLTVASNDTAVTPADALTVYGGGNARMLRLVPQPGGATRRVYVYLNGSGFTSATAIGVRARRKFVQ